MGKVRTDSIAPGDRGELRPAPTSSPPLTGLLVNQGCYEKEVQEAMLRPAPGDSCVPRDFYATTNRRTQVFRRGAWRDVADMRMDGVIVERDGGLACRLIRDVKAGEQVVCTSRSVRIFPLFREQESEEFGFMASDVSSERSVDVAIARVAEELARQKRDGGKVDRRGRPRCHPHRRRAGARLPGARRLHLRPARRQRACRARRGKRPLRHLPGHRP